MASGRRAMIWPMCDDSEAEGRRWVLDGAKSVVLHGDGADRLIVSARTAGERGDPAGVQPVPGRWEAGGVARRASMRDGTRAAEISLSGGKVGAADMLGTPGEAMRGYRAGVRDGHCRDRAPRLRRDRMRCTR